MCNLECYNLIIFFGITGLLVIGGLIGGFYLLWNFEPKIDIDEARQLVRAYRQDPLNPKYHHLRIAENNFGHLFKTTDLSPLIKTVNKNDNLIITNIETEQV